MLMQFRYLFLQVYIRFVFFVPEPPKRNKESSYMIIGVVFGIVCMVVVIIVVICLCLSNKICRCCRNNSGDSDSSVSPTSHDRRRRRRRRNRVQQTHSSQSFEGLGRPWAPYELYAISPLPPYSVVPPCPPPYCPPYQETELTVVPSVPDFTLVPVVQEVREHQPLPASPPPSYSSQDLPPNFLNNYDSQPPNQVGPSQHESLRRTNTLASQRW